MKKIESPQNPLYKTLLATATSPHRAKKNRLVLVEGVRHVEEALASGVDVPAVFFADDEAGKDAAQRMKPLLAVARQRVTLPPSLFAKASQMKTSQGVMALARPLTSELDPYFASLVRRDAALLLLEDVQDPGNVGALIRTADAFSFDGVVLAGSTASLWNPKTSFAAMGSLFHVPVVKEDVPLSAMLEALKAHGFTLYAAVLEGVDLIIPTGDRSGERAGEEGGTIDAADFRQEPPVFAEPRVAVMLGNEGNGLSAVTRQHADRLVRIPMTGRASSLNVASAGAILLWEVFRRRRCGV